MNKVTSISISRKHCFDGCKLQYKYRYVMKYEPSVMTASDVTNKGLALHETFEAALKEGLSREDAEKLLDKQCKKLSVDKAKYFLSEGLDRWFLFKDYIYKTFDIDEVFSEKRYDKPFIADDTHKVKSITILDLLIKCKDGTFVIVDYKTPKTINMSLYKEQLLLYAYTIAVENNIPLSDVDKKIKLFVFFPLFDIGKTKVADFNSLSKCFKELKFTSKEVEDNANAVKSSVGSMESYDFNKPAMELCESTEINAFGGTCAWCPYIGTTAANSPISGFEGCPITAELGLRPTLPIGAKIVESSRK